MAKQKTKSAENVRSTVCDDCGASVPIEDYFGKGDMIYCDDCGAEYVIRSMRPLSLVPIKAEDEEEDE